MKLAVLGVVTVGVGIALGIPGLIGIGALWIPLGLAARAHAQRLQQLRQSRSGATVPAADGSAGPTIDGSTFAAGTLVLLGIGLPSLAVGVLEFGIDAEDAAWRWLPIVVGTLTTGIGVIGGLMYAAGAGVSAVGEALEGGEVPATVRIRSVRETGTFVNERPRLELALEVEPDAASGVAPYEVTKKATVPFTALGSLRVGDGFRALVSGPEKPTAMTIDWSAPVAAVTDGGEGSADVSTRLEELERLRREATISDDEYQAQRQRILGSL
jgi:hypothetical protein